MTTNGTEALGDFQNRPTERPLPDGWTWTTIIDLILPNGIFSDGDWVESKDQDPNGNIRLIQLADIGDGYYRDRSRRFLTYDKAIELNCTFLEKGDVLVARMPDPLGRACLFPGHIKKSVTVVDVCIIRTGLGPVNHRWLMHWINSSIFRNKIEALQSGTTRNRIARRKLATIKFPLPPLEEQERIVAEIEKQFTRLDQAVASLRRLQVNLARYKGSVLKAACEGRLAPQDPQDEPAADLLTRILAERRTQWQAANPGKKYQEVSGVETAVLPDLPEGWVWASLEQISEFVTDGDHNPPKRVSDGIPHLTARNVVDWKLSLDKCTFITIEDFERVKKRYDPTGEDAIITCVGTLGRTAIVPENFTFSADRNLAIVRLLNVGMTPEFLQFNLNTPASQKLMLKGSGSTAQPHLYLKNIRAFPVALASLAEQKRIVAEVERRLSVVAVTEQAITANLARAERLRQSILHRAFTGQLVSQHL